VPPIPYGTRAAGTTETLRGRRGGFPNRHTHLRAAIERTSDEKSRAFLDKS